MYQRHLLNITMFKYMTVFIYFQIINGQFNNEYYSMASNPFPRFISDEEYSFDDDSITSSQSKNLDITVEKISDEFSNGVEPKSTSSLIQDVHIVVQNIKTNINKDFQELTALDAENKEQAKKTISETKAEMENRVRYVENLLYRKREGSVSLNTNIMHCIKGGLNKLDIITPELMKNEEKCISTELDMSRAVVKVTLEILKENLHKVKIHQEHLNKCNTINKRKKLCLIHIYNDVVEFKKTIKTTITPKIEETVTLLKAVGTRMHTCSSSNISKVLAKAGDVIVKFNNCVQSAEQKHKRNSEMLLFVV